MNNNLNNKRTTNEQQMNTNKNNKNIKNIYIYLLRKYKGEHLKSFDEMRHFLIRAKEDVEFKRMSYEEQYDFRSFVLSGGQYGR